LPKREADDHEPGVLAFPPGAPINFTNAAYVRDRLNDAVAAMAEPCRLVVIEANGVIYIDFTGSQVVQKVISDLRERGIEVALARLESERAELTAERSGLIAVLGPDHVFRSVEEAVQQIGSRAKPASSDRTF
jgi:sulfate permease, SulP family